jgi:hypothetical protein
VQTARYDLSGKVGYTFDHLDPYYSYQIDLSLYRGDSVTSAYEVLLGGAPVLVYITGLEPTNRITLNAGNAFMRYATAYVPGGSIGANSLTAEVRRVDAPGPAYLSEIQISQGRQFYVDCGAQDDLPYNGTNWPIGYLDGFAWSPPGATPTTSLRYDYDGAVRYRFTNLTASARYVLFATLWEGDGFGRIERITIDGAAASLPVNLSDAQVHTVVALVPSNAVADRAIDVGITRLNGSDVQVSALQLGYWSQGMLALQDLDADGMPDAFEVANRTPPVGMSALDPTKNDSYGDADRDGMANIYEYYCGTDPLDPSSRLEVVGVAQATAGGGLVLRWPAVSLKFYRIDYTPSLTPQSWNPVGSPIQALADGPMSWTAPDPGPPGMGFYRVVVLSE